MFPGTVTLNLSLSVALLATTAVLFLLGLPAVAVLLIVSVLCVLSIIFGERIESLFRNTLRLPPLESTGESSSPTVWNRLVETLMAREAVVPVGAMAGCLLFGFVGLASLEEALSGKIEIIFLILTFAVVSYGIKQSGYFRYAAFRVLEVCDGQVTRMTLYLFLVSSILTYVTSNDIVILVMTPIVLELCRQSHIRNARLLLLGQFVAANTLSMGLLIGSPTNIIVSQELGLSFADYFFLMFVPSVLAVCASIVILYLIDSFFRGRTARFLGLEWGHDDHYTMPALVEQPRFTGMMAGWILFFALVVVAVAVISQCQRSFFWVTVPTMMLALVVIALSAGASRGGRGAGESTASASLPDLASTLRSCRPGLADCLSSLPFSIVPFALVFFAIADTLVSEISFTDISDWLVGLPVVGNSFLSMLGTAALVNTVNDLPASAIVGEGLRSLEGSDSLARTISLQSTLVSLNIACYLTPIGALAGIIWFHIMRTETSGTGMEVPTRFGMTIYGGLHFLATASTLAVLVPSMNILFNWLTGRGARNLSEISGSEVTVMIVAGVLVLLALLLSITYIFRNHRVLVGDMRAFLTAASWLQVRSQGTGLLFQVLVALLVIVVFGGVILWTEGGMPESGELDSAGDFIVWLFLVLGSGEFRDSFPSSPLDMMVAGLVPLVAIFLILYLIQMSRRTAPLEQTSRRIARGEIITRRSVILDYRGWMRDFVEAVWADRGNGIFQAVLFTDQLPPHRWTEERDYDSIYATEVSLSNDENLRLIVDEFRLDRADEVYLLSDRFYGEGGAHRVAMVVEEIGDYLRALPNSRVGQERYDDIGEGADPEQFAGRLPRIFVWDDVELPPLRNEKMLHLLILLPREWRERTEDRTPRSGILASVSGSSGQRSWRERRREILGP